MARTSFGGVRETLAALRHLGAEVRILADGAEVRLGGQTVVVGGLGTTRSDVWAQVLWIESIRAARNDAECRRRMEHEELEVRTVRLIGPFAPTP